MRNIDTFIPPMEPFVIWSGAFTKNECEQIKSIGELCEFAKARIGEEDAPVTDEGIRKTDIVWIEPGDDTYWIFDRFNELAAKINFDKFQMELSRFDGFQYSKYKTEGHYDWHNDIMLAPKNGLFRKLSFSLMLTEPEDYDGGELLFNLSGDQVNATPLKQAMGDLIVFYSNIPHKVNPVTEGERLSLVTWALGGKVK
ncbi:2OG-Fe(II) oxygenase [Undibacterium sp. Rencai35W]|uniref:2OG-Fe(II) oxygenase n=1 Tax=Undibacterium sp. Rencai35W TaxID=3413046 RepID=UPI003BF444D7